MIRFHETFDRLTLQPEEPVVVAVSGGSDSLAMLLLLQDHLRRSGRSWKVQAVTVDHGLREASAGEAEDVARLCDAHGIGHRVMRWQEEKPAAGVMAAAREARMALLAQAAHECGARVVLVGHTADDQAETVVMRKARGQGRGLAGIAPASLFRQQVWFVRPLLNIRRQELRGWLHARGIRWIDDPSNENISFERVATRRHLAGADISGVLAEQRASAAAREEENINLADFLALHLGMDEEGRLLLSRSALMSLSPGPRALCVRTLCAAAGGAEQLPDENSAALVLENISAGRGASLARAVISYRKDVVRFAREQRNLPRLDLADATPDCPFVWDGRYEIVVRKKFDGQLGAGGRSALPAAWFKGEQLDKVGQDDIFHARPLVAPWSRLLPSFDLPLAAAIGNVIGAGLLPHLPLQGHNGRQGLTE